MKAEWINAFLIATRDTFQRMLNMQAQHGKPQLIAKESSGKAISGVIGISGGLKGVVVMGFPESTALALVEAFVGEKFDKLCPEVSDAVGELANIIAGYAKQHLNVSDVQISLPSVIRGPDHFVQMPKGVPVLVIPYTTPKGDFLLEVSLKAADA